MTKLQRYYFAQLIPVFLLVMTGLTLIALLTQSLSQLDLLFERGQSAGTFLGISLLATPQIMAVVMPVALFAAVASAYGRLHQDNEIVVAFSSGSSVWAVAEPAFRLAVMGALAALVVNLFVQPVAQREMRDRLFAIRSDFASTIVKEGEFRSTVDGLMVFARRIERGGTMTGLLISDTKSTTTPVIYVAKTGTIAKFSSGPVIVLRDGSVQRKLENGTLDIVGFSTYVMELRGFSNDELQLFYKPSDRFLPQLLKPDLTDYWDRAHVGDLLAEAHRRLAAPLLCLASVALALMAILGGQFSRLGYTRRIGAAFGGLVVMLLAFTGFIPTIGDQPSLGFLLYILPIAILFFTTGSMRNRYARMVQHRPLNPRGAS